MVYTFTFLFLYYADFAFFFPSVNKAFIYSFIHLFTEYRRLAMAAIEPVAIVPVGNEAQHLLSVRHSAKATHHCQFT